MERTYQRRAAPSRRKPIFSRLEAGLLTAMFAAMVIDGLVLLSGDLGGTTRAIGVTRDAGVTASMLTLPGPQQPR
jgi:hypothetical protein